MRFLLALSLTWAMLACSDSTGPGLGSAVLTVLSGDEQTGFQNTALDEPIVVQLTRANGNPVSGARMNVSVQEGGGVLLEADSVTDVQGQLRIRWQLGEDYENSLRVSVLEHLQTSVRVRATARYLYLTPEETEDGWNASSLGEVGLNPEPLARMMEALRTGGYEEVHSVVIVKDDRLVFEEYFPGHDFGYTGAGFHGALLDFGRETTHNTHSATKSIVSALVGIAIDQGLIPGEEEPVFSFFPDYASYSVGGKEAITLRHLLTMTSGLEWHEWDAPVGGGQNSMEAFNSSGDHIRYVLSMPLLHEPGTVFNYNGGTVNILCQVVARASGMGVDRFAADHLFGPLGITRYSFPRLPDGFIPCHGDIYLRPRDMAKIGHLYLNQGMWQGQRILPEEWVERSVASLVSLANWHLYWADDYGYLWWRRGYTSGGTVHPVFKAMGWGGQEIWVLPESNMVVVFTGANYTQDPPCDDLMLRYVFPSLH